MFPNFYGLNGTKKTLAWKIKIRILEGSWRIIQFCYKEMAESNLAQFVQKARYIGSKKYPTTLVTKVLVYEENLAFSQASR